MNCLVLQSHRYVNCCVVCLLLSLGVVAGRVVHMMCLLYGFCSLSSFHSIHPKQTHI